MKAEELRIGNIVGSYNKGDEERMLTVLPENIKVQLKANKQGYTRYRPIPLTEELLLKCGFDKIEYSSDENGYGVEYILSVDGIDGFILEYCDDFSISIKGREEDYGITPPLNRFKYLHQLQNIYFALTNEELKIET